LVTSDVLVVVVDGVAEDDGGGTGVRPDAVVGVGAGAGAGAGVGAGGVARLDAGDLLIDETAMARSFDASL
jgi:hypothetical protein